MSKHALSFNGCRTRAEAEQRLRTWLEQIVDDASRKMQSDILVNDDDRVDVDTLDAAIEQNAQLTQQSIEEAVAQFHRLLDREFGPKGGA